MSRVFASLAERNYRLYAAGSLVSNTGTWMMNTAQAWLVLVMTGNGTAVGITVALQLLPTVIFSPVGGMLADRYPKEVVLRWLQLAMAIPALILGILAVTGVVELWHVYVLALVFGIGRALEGPPRQSFVPELVAVENLSNAVALNSASFNAGRTLGPSLAGVLIAVFGSGIAAPGWVMVLNAFSYGASYAALALLDPDRLRSPEPGAADDRPATGDALRYVRRRPDLILVFSCVFFIGGFGMGFQIVSALMVRTEFGLGAGAYGLAGTLLAAGSLCGALAVARRRTSGGGVRVIAVGALTLSALQVVSGVMPTFTTYALVLPLLGAAFLITGTIASAIIQLGTDAAVRGRVTALYLMVFVGSVPAVSPLLGWCGDAWGPRAAAMISGLISGLGVAGSCGWYLAAARRKPSRVLSMPRGPAF